MKLTVAPINSGTEKRLVPDRLRELTGMLLLLVSTCTIVACTEPPPPIPPVIRTVKTVLISATNSGEQVSQTGEVKPHEETSLGFRIEGRILQRRVDVGAIVQQGDLLATLDSRDGENNLRTAKAGLDSALSAERLAKSTLNRMKQLAPGGAISASQLDQTRSEWEAAVSRRQSAEAQLKSAEEQLSFTQLHASATGVVSAVSANQGQVVSAGQEVVKLASLQGRDAVFNIAEQLVNSNLENPLINVSLLSDPRVTTEGRIRDISPVADPVSRTFRVRVTLNSAPDAFVFGASVLGTVQLPTAKHIALPASALTRKGKQSAVYIVDMKTMTLELQPLQIARYSDTEIFVSEGLNIGDRVVTAGVRKLRPGEQVKLMQGAQ